MEIIIGLILGAIFLGGKSTYVVKEKEKYIPRKFSREELKMLRNMKMTYRPTYQSFY